MCVLDHVPFVYQRTGEVGYKVDTKQIIQSLLTAGVTALVIMYATQQSIMVEMAAIRDDVKEVKESVKDMRKDLYVPRDAKSR